MITTTITHEDVTYTATATPIDWLAFAMRTVKPETHPATLGGASCTGRGESVVGPVSDWNRRVRLGAPHKFVLSEFVDGVTTTYTVYKGHKPCAEGSR